MTVKRTQMEFFTQNQTFSSSQEDTPYTLGGASPTFTTQVSWVLTLQWNDVVTATSPPVAAQGRTELPTAGHRWLRCRLSPPGPGSARPRPAPRAQVPGAFPVGGAEQAGAGREQAGSREEAGRSSPACPSPRGERCRGDRSSGRRSGAGGAASRSGAAASPARAAPGHGGGGGPGRGGALTGSPARGAAVNRSRGSAGGDRPRRSLPAPRPAASRPRAWAAAAAAAGGGAAGPGRVRGTTKLQGLTMARNEPSLQASFL
ncbi:translation initiation factor IF-2-like [Malurus melanocephalus]|uniref:translation initiation factor IF-2-like n=1 Tax=Malurus melanocephalus TaxID=175006 RepID=UPI0025467541|nr:translation initiation factor IF-2-like [Malurus melanocephalus]